MESRNPTLDILFEGRKEYVVPPYQRLYVWDRDGQWAPLWVDITNIAKALVIGATVPPHFFGAIVLKKSEGITDADENVYRVIDGQQRLTTMQLLIAAAADEMEFGRPRYPVAAESLRELLTYSSIELGTRFKMRHRSEDYANFPKVMGAQGNTERILDLGCKMADCYLYFRDAVKTWLNEADAEAHAKALTTTLRTKLRTVAIYLAPAEPEHLVFETLNARGAPLTEWDKVRNYLLYRVQQDLDGRFPDDPKRVDERLMRFDKDRLSRFDDDWWREESGRGQDKRPRTDRFVDYWLESTIEEPVVAARVFREFRDRAENRDQEALVAWVETMARDADYYHEFESGEAGATGFEATFHERRKWVEIGSIWPFLFGLRRKDLNRQQLRSVMSTLESWWVRRWIRGHRGHSYPDRALDLLRRVSKAKDGADVPRIVLDRLDELKDAGGRWPRDGELKKAVVENFHSFRLCRLILEGVERHLTPPKAEKNPPKHGVLQIEHIMPVKWKEWWPIGGHNTPDAEEERDGWIQTLGNLTLVHEKLNPSMGNGPWKEKQEAISENSTLFLNKDLLRRAPDTWDEDAIRKRGEWLAEQVCEIWPHAEVLKQRLGEP